jgi:hypothetical protein
MAAPVPVEKQVPVTKALDSNTSTDDSSSQLSADDHVFKDRVTAQYWRDVYDKAEYEGRHRFDPDYTWTEAEEKRLVRKVRSRLPTLRLWLMISSSIGKSRSGHG